MATVAGSITSLTLVGAPVGGQGARKVAMLNCSFAVYTTSDTAVITNAAVAIQNIQGNGKTVTIKGGLAGNIAGLGSGGTAAYAHAVTASTSTISCSLGSATGDLSTPASQGVGIYVMFEES
jgi:hypothetical protein